MLGACPATDPGLAALLGIAAGTIIYSGSNNETTSSYIVTFAAGGTATAYTLQATPQGSQVADTKCKTFTLTNTGVKAITGTPAPTGTAAECW